MKTARLLVGCCIASALVLACAPRWRLPLEAPSPPPVSQAGAPPEAAAIAALQARLAELPAITAAVAGPQGVWWSHAEGWADVGTREPARPATRFRIYSVTKA